jgi:phosphoglycolate phosphatase
MTDHEAVVYDLDGTLVDLPVDWASVDRRVGRTLAERAGVEPAGRQAWDLLPVADEHGERAAVEAVISEHERRAAPDATRLPLAEELLAGERPAGVCSLNCEAAVRTALDTHGLTGSVRSVVGRDTVATEKPDPEPLLRVVRELGAKPGETLFVGDSASDEETAERAGTAFAYVEERLNRS